MFLKILNISLISFSFFISFLRLFQTFQNLMFCPTKKSIPPPPLTSSSRLNHKKIVIKKIFFLCFNIFMKNVSETGKNVRDTFMRNFSKRNFLSVVSRDEKKILHMTPQQTSPNEMETKKKFIFMGGKTC